MERSDHQLEWGLRLCVLATALFASATSRADSVKPEQLVGSWVHVGPADMSGLEFAPGGKVTIYFVTADQGFTADYSIGADGRLNLAEQGLSNFLIPSLAGGQLTLKEVSSGKVATYRRLKGGETMAAAIATQSAADAKSVQDRNRAIPNFLTRKDLVMLVINGGNAMPASNAIELVPNGDSFAGRICYGSNPPKLEPIGAQVQGSAENPAVNLWFGPGTAQQNRMSFIFHSSGTADAITLTSKVNLGRDAAFSGDAPTTVIIKADTALHQQIIGNLKTEITRMDAAKAPIMALLKDYVVLKGDSQSNLPAERDGYIDRFTLTRNPQNGTYVGQGQLVNRATGATEIFNCMAVVGIIREKPAIQIQSQKRVYLFTDIDAKSAKLSGVWQMPQNPQAHKAELTIAQAADTKTRDQLFAGMKASLQKLGPETVFHALVSDQGNSSAPNPVTVTLSVAAGGVVSGKAEYPLEGCTITLGGKMVDTPLGPQMLVQYTAGEAGPNAWGDAKAFMNAVQHEAWLLSPGGEPGPAMRLEGQAIANTAQRTPPVSIQLIPYTAKDRAAIAAALSSGTKFHLINPRMGPEVDVIEFATDPATSKIKGHLLTAGHQINNSPNSTFSGEIKDESGWVKMDMPILRPVDREPTYAYTIVATPTDGGLYLSAGVYNIRQGRGGSMGRWDAVEMKPQNTDGASTPGSPR